MLTIQRQRELANGAQMTDEEREYVRYNGLSPRICATDEMTSLYALMFASNKKYPECLKHYRAWSNEFYRREFEFKKNHPKNNYS